LSCDTLTATKIDLTPRESCGACAGPAYLGEVTPADVRRVLDDTIAMALRKARAARPGLRMQGPAKVYVGGEFLGETAG
jgi:hypothetical protein